MVEVRRLIDEKVGPISSLRANVGFTCSKWDISFVNFYFLRSAFGRNRGFSKKIVGKKDANYYLFNRYFRVLGKFSGARVGVYTGSRFQSFIVRPQIQGSRFDDYLFTIKHPVKRRLAKGGKTGVKRKKK